MSLVQNERLKLAATALNQLAVAALVIGVFTPMVAVLYGTVAVSAAPPFALLAGFAFFIGGIVLHVSAHLLLGGLKG